MNIERKAGIPRGPQGIVGVVKESPGRCIGCARCEGCCQALIEALSLPELILGRE